MLLVLQLIDSDMLLLYVRLTFEVSVMFQRWHVCESQPLREQEAVPTRQQTNQGECQNEQGPVHAPHDDTTHAAHPERAGKCYCCLP
jgi:hypothetical protein